MKFDENGWCDEAIEVAVLGNSMSRQGMAPTDIVEHGTAGGVDAVAIARYFQTTVGTDHAASTHFVIGRDGTLVQCIPVSLAAWANGLLLNPRLPFPSGINPNLYTISIEHCKPSGDNSDALTPAQLDTSIRLNKALCEHYGIAKRRGRGGILYHSDLDSVNRARCPGPFPEPQFLAGLNGTTATTQATQEEDDMAVTMQDATMQRYFVDAGNGVIKRKDTGQTVLGAICSYYLKMGGAAVLGLPITGELYPVSGTAVQGFERGIICYDPGPQRKIDHPPVPADQTCYLLHVDTGYGQKLLSQSLVAPLQSKTSQLQAQVEALQSKLSVQNSAPTMQADLAQIAQIANKYKVS